MGVLLASLLALAASAAPADYTYPVTDAPGLGRTFDGVGAESGGGDSRLLVDYDPAAQQEILDMLFLPSYGASLQVLKLEIGSDTDSTSGAERCHRRSPGDAAAGRFFYEFWLAQEAKKRNPGIALYGLPFGFPGYLANLSSDAPYGDAAAATADYVVSWMALARDEFGLSIDFVGVWNEVSAISKYIELSDYIVTLRRALDAAGFGAAGIVAADQVSFDIVDLVASNATVRAAVAALGFHYTGTDMAPAALPLGLPLWASEDSAASGAAGGACISRLVPEAYVAASKTMFVNWGLLNSFYGGLEFSGTGLVDANTPWSGAWAPKPALWAMAHIAQFTARGWHFLAHGAGVGYLSGGGTFAALTDGHGNLTLLVEKVPRSAPTCLWGRVPPNITSPEVARFVLGGAFARLASVFVWHSNYSSAGDIDEADMLHPLSPLAAVGGVLTLPLREGDVYTLTTVGSGRHGGPVPPPPPPPGSPFPLPYSDSFDAAPLGADGAFVSALAGSFEVVPAAGGAPRGRALRQSVAFAPIPWALNNSAPHAVLGDVSWADVSVSVDVLLEDAAHTAAVGLRCASVTPPQGNETNEGIGAWLVVSTHRWAIARSVRAMAANASAGVAGGAIEPPLAAGTWHSLTFSARGASGAAYLDDMLLVGALDMAFAPAAGWAGLATAAFGHTAQFDALSVHPT